MLLFGNPTLANLISIAIALLIGTTFHEYMHNYVGWLMGDNTPAYQGKLTLDPRKHIYWPGWLMFVLIGFGVLGTAPINPNAMTNPRVAWAQRLDRRQRFGLAVAAGPFANLIVAVVAGLLYRVTELFIPEILYANPVPGNPTVLPSLASVLFMLVFWNVLLFFFNLIPLGPLDGRYILGMFIPPQSYYGYESFQTQYGMMVLFGLIFISFINPAFNIFGRLISGPTFSLTSMLTGL